MLDGAVHGGVSPGGHEDQDDFEHVDQHEAENAEVMEGPDGLPHPVI